MVSFTPRDEKICMLMHKVRENKTFMCPIRNLEIMHRMHIPNMHVSYSKMGHVSPLEMHIQCIACIFISNTRGSRDVPKRLKNGETL